MQSLAMVVNMDATMEKTGAWLPDESYLSEQNHLNAIKAHIKAYYENTPDDTTYKDDVDFIANSFLCSTISMQLMS